MSAYGTEELALEAMRRGAYDYLAKPFQPAEVLLAIRKAQERERLRRKTELLARDVERAVGERPIVAASPTMIEVLELIERAAEYKATVLLDRRERHRQGGARARDPRAVAAPQPSRSSR